MAGIIKGGMGYGYLPPQAEQPVMKTIYGSKPVQLDKKEQVKEEKQPEPVKAAEEVTTRTVIEAEEFESTEYIREEDAKIERQILIEEYEQLRIKYEKESEEYVLRAKEKAAEIYEKTKEIAHQTVSEAKAEGAEIKKSAYEAASKEGYEAGYKAGYDEGYVNALKKCRDTLLELKGTAESITAKKNEMFLSYEHALFDVIFEIAQKITVNSLKQKDKAIITKMIREAGKRFRGSKAVKISLSGLDISEEAEIDDELLADIFKGGTNVEIEILKDAPSGTLIIDNGAEITDASVQTQLKMIENIGRGKYRDKSFTDMVREQRESKDSLPAEGEEESPDIMNMIRKTAERRKKPATKKAKPVGEEAAAENPDTDGDEG